MSVSSGEGQALATEHVDVGELRIAFRRTGSGEPLLLLHGAVSDSRVWRVAMERLADEFAVVAWDAPGCGGSSDAPDGYRISDYADRLSEFIDAVGLRQPHVMGHSWGSTLALELCNRHPSTVRSLVLVGGYAGWAGSLPADEVGRRLSFALRTADALEAGGWDPKSMPGLFSDAMPATRAAELEEIMAEIRATTTRTMARALAEADLRDELAGIVAPTLLVYGDADQRSGLDVAHDLQRRLPRSELVVLRGLGHECYLENPAAFDAAVRPFLRAN